MIYIWQLTFFHSTMSTRAMVPRFEFSSTAVPTFTGFAFYSTYKDADFLRHDDHIVTILSKGHQLRQKLKELPPGGRMILEGMYVSRKYVLSHSFH